MPLVRCLTCQQQVSDTAEVCPHCGEDQPEKHFRQHPGQWVWCPMCSVKNHLLEQCRNCGASLAEVTAKWRRRDSARRFAPG